MIDMLLLLGFAVFAIAVAVSRTEVFAWLRNTGRLAYALRQPWYLLATPLRATLCTTCFSFWAAIPAPWLPIVPELEGVSRILLWLAPVGISIVLAFITEPSERDSLRLPDLNDIGPRPDGLTDAAHQTADEVP